MINFNKVTAQRYLPVGLLLATELLYLPATVFVWCLQKNTQVLHASRQLSMPMLPLRCHQEALSMSFNLNPILSPILRRLPLSGTHRLLVYHPSGEVQLSM